MMNSEETYFEAGKKCSIARKKRDESTASHFTNWFSKAIALETGENKQRAQDAFNNGYKEGSGQQGFHYLKETGEWDDGDEYMVAWKQKLEDEIRYLESASGGKLKFVSVHGFDAYQGPYAWAKINGKNYKIWTNEDQLWIDGYPVDNTSKEGMRPGFAGGTGDILEMLIGNPDIIQHGFSLNETHDVGHPRVKGGDKPMRWGNGEIASLNDRLENGYAVAKFVSTENAVRYSRSKWNKMGWDEQKKYAAQMNRKVVKYNIQFKDESWVPVPKAMYDMIQLPETSPKNYWQEYSA